MRRKGLKEQTSPPEGDPQPDEGWRYNPGQAHWGRPLADGEIEYAASARWRPLEEGARGPEDFGRPERIPYEPMPVKPAKRLEAYLGAGLTEAEARAEVKETFRRAIGGETVEMIDAAGEPVVLSDYLFEHLKLDGREAFFPLIPDLLKDPHEIWLSFEKQHLTGRVRMRRRYIKFYRDAKKRHLMLVAECQRGSLVAYTIFRGTRRDYFERFRRGHLVYGK